MTQARDSEFGYISPIYFYSLLIYAVLCAVLYTFVSPVAVEILIITFQVVSAFVHPFLCMAGSVTVSMFSSVVFPGYLQVLISVIIILSLFCHNWRMVFHFRGLLFFSFSVLAITVSYLAGIDPEINNAILMLLCVIRVVLLNNTPMEDDFSVLIMGYIGMGIATFVYFLLSLMQNQFHTTYHRLSFEGDIKAVSVSVVFAMMIILLCRLDGKSVFSNVGNAVIEYLLVAAFFVILFLTLARGILAASAVGILLFTLLSKRGRYRFVLFIPVLVIVLFVIMMFVDEQMFFVQRLNLSEEFTDFNGRTTIWGFYFERIKNSGLIHVIFGVGPGNIGRIGDLGRYAHSTFLDFYFCYGLVGFVAVMFLEIKSLVRIIITGNYLAVALFLTFALVYATHGSSANTALFTAQIILLKWAEVQARSPLHDDTQNC